MPEIVASTCLVRLAAPARFKEKKEMTLPRFDRIAKLYVFHPVARVAGGKGALPILMYHSVSDDAEPGVPAYYKTSTSPTAFERQLEYFHGQGYRTISLESAVDYLEQGNLPDGKQLVITFDDGYSNIYTHAYPALQKFGFTATVFLPTAFIGTQRRAFNGVECLTWGETLELRRCGIRFGSHTVTHPRLTDLNWQQIERELKESRSELEERLQETVTTFAYPFAYPQAAPEFTKRFRQLLEEAGYQTNVTTQIGRAKPGDDRYALKRLPVNSEDDQALLQAKLEGGYEWLALPQNVYKQIKQSFQG